MLLGQCDSREFSSDMSSLKHRHYVVFSNNSTTWVIGLCTFDTQYSSRASHLLMNVLRPLSAPAIPLTSTRKFGCYFRKTRWTTYLNAQKNFHGTRLSYTDFKTSGNHFTYIILAQPKLQLTLETIILVFLFFDLPAGMGTRGYYVLRYRNMYFAQYHNYDSYPDGLGVKVLQSMRWQPNAITTYRQVLGEILDGFDHSSQLFIEGGGDLLPPSRLRPENDILIEWVYEIDLDRNIFHINGMPFFALECLPGDKAFIQYISKDHYGLLACASQCPPKHRYKRPIPPTVNNSDLATYQSFMCTGSHVALSDLLAINDFLTPDEYVRVSLLEVMIGQCMIHPVIGEDIYNIGIVFDHSQLTDDQWSIACFMASIAFVPPIFDDIQHTWHPEPNRKEFTWVREDIVVFIASHLDDERCLQASVSRLINAIMEQKDNLGDYFGIAFSVYHCALVKVVKDAHTMTFSHTNALQFLPSFYACSPSTPGITALARLSLRIDPALFTRVVEIYRYNRSTEVGNETGELLVERADGSNDVPPNIICPPLPFELWKEIALHLYYSELISFGLVSKLFREVASEILRYPHLCGYRLVATKPRYIQDQHLSLQAAAFSAVRAGVSATVLFGLAFKNGPSAKLPAPLTVRGDHSLWVLTSDAID